ncbi:AAA-like domain-containing protein [Coleofasciculus sp. E1-EBD-02]|uniref:AAA-like domain-containing protein n=1 Tax=Coleofasciculus sp. E1-EBD-02 TaxID=3068481 RepID=UPI0032F52573
MKRRRGVILTPVGLKRLQAGIQAVEIAENNGNRLTLEELGDRINLSTKTLSRLWSLNTAVDQRTLKLCFAAFDLQLHPEDYTTCSEPDAKHRGEGWEEAFTQNPELKNPLTPQLPYPDGPVSLNSPLYIERPPLETLAYQTLVQPGCAIRICAPKQMGKSSLMLRLLDFAQTQHYSIVYLDCKQICPSWLSDINRFLWGFCSHVAKQLGVNPDLESYWHECLGCKLSCSFYFKDYLLQVIDSPVVLVLNELDRLFNYPTLSQEFFSLLRSWYEEARGDEIWQKLRLVLVYSTQKDVPGDSKHASFNFGLPIYLPEFTPLQVQDLAKRHGLNWSSGKEVTALMKFFGGHPYLIRMALYHISTRRLSVDQLHSLHWDEQLHQYA